MRLDMLRKLVLAVILAVGVATTSEASVIAFSDTVEGEGLFGLDLIASGHPYAYRHDVNDSIDLGSTGILDATLAITLYDALGRESLVVDIGAVLGSIVDVPNSLFGTTTYTFELSPLQIAAYLQDGGVLGVNLSLAGRWQSVVFVRSVLSGHAETAPAPAPGAPAELPEPGSLLLLGLGCLVAFACRRVDRA